MGRGQVTSGLRSVLSHPLVYDGFERAIGSHHARLRFVRDYLCASDGARILDIGCGTGDLLAYLGNVEYVGVDISPEYIHRARRRFVGRAARFRVGDAASIGEADGSYDLVVATGVVHHLPDDEARSMFSAAASALTPTGRLVLIDPAYSPGQSRVARFVIDRDRGQCVRTPASYAALAAPWFGEVERAVIHDMLRIPYTHCILACSRPRSS